MERALLQARKLLNKHSIPNYPSSERAVASLKALCDYTSIKVKEHPAPVTIPVNREAAQKIIDDAIAREGDPGA